MSRTHVAKLVAGNVFGEMGMMTGEPRRATVTAKTDVDCYRLDKAGFTDILMARPDLAGEISKVLADRNIELAKHRAEIERSRMQTNHQDILGKIRGFFGIKA
jgi:CRP-like cAMP-binding protein